MLMADLELIRDFVNTADLEGRRDDLLDARGLVRWLAQHRLAGEHVRARATDAEEARAVREALRELLRSNNGVAVDEAAAAATLDAASRRAGLTVRFAGDAIRLEPRERGVSGALGTVLAAVAVAVARGGWPRVKAGRPAPRPLGVVDKATN